MAHPLPQPLMRFSFLLALALLTATTWAQEVAPFEPFVEEATLIVEAPVEEVRALATQVWPDVLITGARPDQAAPWTAEIAPYERGSHVRLVHLVQRREEMASGAIGERMDALSKAVKAAPLHANAYRLPAGGDLACIDQWAKADSLLAEMVETTTDDIFSRPRPPDLLPNQADGMQALHERLVYPEAAKRQGIEGRVFVKLIIDRQGHPVCLGVARGVHPLLDSAAVEAVAGVRFVPPWGNAPRLYKPIGFSLPITFRLAQPSAE